MECPKCKQPMTVYFEVRKDDVVQRRVWKCKSCGVQQEEEL